MKIKVNHKHVVHIDNIDHIQMRGKEVCLVMKTGYPKIIKCRWSYNWFLNKLINSGCSTERLKELIL